MIRSELAARVAEQNPHLYQRDAEAIVDAVLNTIADALARGDRVELRDFGSFAVEGRPARLGRNPRTGEAVHVPAGNKLYFKAGKGMRAQLNRPTGR